MTPLLFALLQDVQPQEPPPLPPASAPAPAPAPPPAEPIPQPPPPPPTIGVAPPPAEAQPAQEPEEKMSEGRMLVHLYNSGFQWGISPGVVIVRGDPGFALGVHVGYGIDTGPLIFVPGIQLSGFFTDPSVWVGMPALKVVIPIDRFAPFVEGGVGLGYVSDPSKTGVALRGGGGFMVHFRPIALGAQVSYQTITGTNFRGIGVGPIIAIGF